MKFNVYREVRRQQRAHEWGRPEPTKVATIEADDVAAAVEEFLDTRPLNAGWREPVVEVSGRSRRQTADLWLRRYTPTGRYRGETHFIFWP